MKHQLLRFGAVGVVNTLIGFAVIVALSRGLGVDNFVANLLGFAAGALGSYLLNRSFTFGSRKAHRHAAPAFALLVCVCVIANLAMLGIGLHMLRLPPMLAQALAVLTYNAIFFTGSRSVIFDR